MKNRPLFSIGDPGERAFAIPLVILTGVILLIFSILLINSNVQSKKQQNSTILSTKAYFMALGGLQHYKLKYKLFPGEFYKCSCMYHGYSPFYTPKQGHPFDQFDKENAKNIGPCFPEFVAYFLEDINTFSDAADKSTRGGKTVGGARTLIKTGNPERAIKQMGGFQICGLSAGGLKMTDEDARENFSEWGYRVVDFKCWSLKKENNPEKLKGSPPFIEQSVTIEIEGTARSNVGGANSAEEAYRKHVLTETIVLKRTIGI